MNDANGLLKMIVFKYCKTIYLIVCVLYMCVHTCVRTWACVRCMCRVWVQVYQGLGMWRPDREQCRESVLALHLGSRQVSLAVHCCGRASWLPASGGSVSVSHSPESRHWNHRWLSSCIQLYMGCRASGLWQVLFPLNLLFVCDFHNMTAVDTK